MQKSVNKYELSVLQLGQSNQTPASPFIYKSQSADPFSNGLKLGADQNSGGKVSRGQSGYSSYSSNIGPSPVVGFNFDTQGDMQAAFGTNNPLLNTPPKPMGINGINGGPGLNSINFNGLFPNPGSGQKNRPGMMPQETTSSPLPFLGLRENFYPPGPANKSGPLNMLPQTMHSNPSLGTTTSNSGFGQMHNPMSHPLYSPPKTGSFFPSQPQPQQYQAGHPFFTPQLGPRTLSHQPGQQQPMRRALSRQDSDRILSEASIVFYPTKL